MVFAKRTVVIIASVAILVTAAYADTVYLKNGREMEGVITEETQEYVVLAVNVGSVKFYKNQIERIVHYSKRENQELEGAWEEERAIRQAKAQRLQQAASSAWVVEAERRGDHLLVNALFNGRTNASLMVDTGSSSVMLSLKKAREVGFEIRDDTPDARMRMADGAEVPVKLFTAASLDVSGASATEIVVAVPFDDKVLTEFDGLLGMSFLKLFKFEIDLENNRLVLQKQET